MSMNSLKQSKDKLLQLITKSQTTDADTKTFTPRNRKPQRIVGLIDGISEREGQETLVLINVLLLDKDISH